MKSKIRILCIGNGFVVNNRHIPTIKRNPAFKLIGKVASESSNLAESLKNVDAVTIGTPPRTHFKLAETALLLKKHVLLEKPATIKPTELQDLDIITRHIDPILMLIHNFKYSRAILKLKKFITQDKLGALKTVYGTQMCNLHRKIPNWCHESPLGLFFDEAIHFVYLFMDISKDPNIKLITSYKCKHPDYTNTPARLHAIFKNRLDLPLILNVDFTSSYTEWWLTVIGTRGTAFIDIWRDIFIFLPNDRSHGALEILKGSINPIKIHLLGTFTGAIRYITGRHLYGNDVILEKFKKAIWDKQPLKELDATEGIAALTILHELIEKTHDL